jgi:hypothetical protein
MASSMGATGDESGAMIQSMTGCRQLMAVL